MILLVFVFLFILLVAIDSWVVMQIFSTLHSYGMNVPAIGFWKSVTLALLFGALLVRPNFKRD